jgi:hypothetical protein
MDKKEGSSAKEIVDRQKEVDSQKKVTGAV